MGQRVVHRDDAARGGADQMEAVKQKVRGERLEVIDRAALGAPVVGDEAVAQRGERRNLVLPHGARARPGMQEDDRRARAAEAVLLAQTRAETPLEPQRFISPRYFSTPGWTSSRRGAAASVFAIVVSRACSSRAASGPSARCTARASR